MAFSTEDLRSEIAELFEAAQAPYEEAAMRQALSQAAPEAGTAQHAACNPGYRIFRPDVPRDDRRRKGDAAYRERVEKDDIRTRLLAGERPKMGGRGRPPTRWIKIADELGIDLKRTVTAETPLNSVAKSLRPAILALRAAATTPTLAEPADPKQG